MPRPRLPEGDSLTWGGFQDSPSALHGKRMKSFVGIKSLRYSQPDLKVVISGIRLSRFCQFAKFPEYSELLPIRTRARVELQLLPSQESNTGVPQSRSPLQLSSVHHTSAPELFKPHSPISRHEHLTPRLHLSAPSTVSSSSLLPQPRLTHLSAIKLPQIKTTTAPTTPSDPLRSSWSSSRSNAKP